MVSGDMRTPLIYAVFSGKIDNAKFLIEKGADVNKKESQFGSSPLQIALMEMRPEMAEMVRLLLDRGADPMVTDNDGQTPLYTAIDRGTLPEVYAVLVARKPDTLSTPNTDGSLPPIENLTDEELSRFQGTLDREIARIPGDAAKRRMPALAALLAKRRAARAARPPTPSEMAGRAAIKRRNDAAAATMKAGRRRRRRGVKAGKSLKRKRNTRLRR